MLSVPLHTVAQMVASLIYKRPVTTANPVRINPLPDVKILDWSKLKEKKNCRRHLKVRFK